MDHNYRSCSDQNWILVGKYSDIFGLSWMSDGAVFYRMPLINNILMCDYVPPTVVDIHDCMYHMAAGVRRIPNICLG